MHSHVQKREDKQVVLCSRPCSSVDLLFIWFMEFAVFLTNRINTVRSRQTEHVKVCIIYRIISLSFILFLLNVLLFYLMLNSLIDFCLDVIRS